MRHRAKRWRRAWRARRAGRARAGLVRAGPRRGAVLGGYDGVLKIVINHHMAGFFAYLTFAVNQLRHAERRNLYPVVCFGPWSGDGPNAYHDPSRGENMWDSYFEPVMPLSWSDVETRLVDPADPLRPEDVVELDERELWYLHRHDPRSVFAYAYGIYRFKTRYDPAWFDRNRREAHRVLERHVRVRPHVTAIVDAFAAEHFGDGPVLGVHVRGTDKGSAGAPPGVGDIVPLERYFEEIDARLQRRPELPCVDLNDPRRPRSRPARVPVPAPGR